MSNKTMNEIYNAPVSVAEFTRVELDRRLAVLTRLTVAYDGHATPGELERAETEPQRRADIIDLLRSLADAAVDANVYAVKFAKQLQNGEKVGDG